MIKPPIGTSLRLDHPLAQGLTGCWLLNENSGATAYDYSGRANNGTLSGYSDPPIATSGWGAGPYGTSLYHDGTNDYIAVATESVCDFGGNPATIVSNVCTGASAVTGYTKSIVGKNRAPATNGFMFGVYDNQWMWWVSGSYVLSSTGFSANSWFSVIGVFNGNGNNIVLYVNGTSIGTPTAATCTDNNTTLMIGRSGRWDVAADYWQGSISDVMIYNRALSTQEIAMISSKPYCMFEEANPYSVFDLKLKRFPFWKII